MCPLHVSPGSGLALSFRKNIKASAVCQYNFADVQKVFDGPYMEVQDSKWREYTGKVPEPRPGSVSFIKNRNVHKHKAGFRLQSAQIC